ncbi:MAG: CPBP family intramembrane metalloprotease [Muribaculaceae bacterium]|nr:CPBP family intramembrane metalloprotease [Muribaculaceae bacterium]
MDRKTNMKLGTRLLILLCLMGVGLIVASVVGVLVLNLGLLTMLTVQDVLAFIVPAIVAMAIFYRRPFHAMCLDRIPGWRALVLVIVFYVVSLPAMNWLVEANQAMSLPSWMSGIEKMMRALEDSAADATEQLLDINSAWQMLACMLVVGFMAGLSEEMLFRGAMQRTMHDSRLGVHAAVWITAILFSAFHMQFFGFFPRMILGVWLGYLLVWSRSLWVPIIAHTLNNSNVVFFSYLANKGVVAEDFGDQLGLPAEGAFPWLAVVSLVVSIAIAVWAHRHRSILQK